MRNLRIPGVLALAMAPMAVAAQGQPAQHHATGTFEVKVTPEASDTSGAMPMAGMALGKVFSGGMTGNAKGLMLSAGAPKPGSAAAYVALDQFTGSVDGKTGGFLLVHRGFMTKAGGGDLDVVIAPDTGTGALEGIAGTLKIEVKDGKHFYDLSYTLPGKP